MLAQKGPGGIQICVKIVSRTDENYPHHFKLLASQAELVS